MKNTRGIIATVLTGIFLGIPGLIMAVLGLIAGLGSQIPAVAAESAYTTQEIQSSSLIFMVGGLLLMLVPIIVGIVTLRKKKEPAFVSPTAHVQTTPTLPFTPPAVSSVPPVTSAKKPVLASPSTPPPPPTWAGKKQEAANQTPSVPVAPSDAAADIRTRILSLNRPTAPWHIIDGTSEGVDLIAEWKIVDAQWNEVFAKAKFSKEYRILMKFDPSKRVVRAMDKEKTVQLHTGFPTLHAEASTFRGQQTSISFGTGYTFTETLAPGQIYKYRFNSNELKKPIQETIKQAGWSYKEVAFGKL